MYEIVLCTENRKHSYEDEMCIYVHKISRTPLRVILEISQLNAQILVL